MQRYVPDSLPEESIAHLTLPLEELWRLANGPTGWQPDDPDRRNASRFPLSRAGCQDLSVSGVGFMMPQKPPTDVLVIDLGSPRGSWQAVLVAARVVHCEPCQAGNRQCYSVGCEFIKRLT